jgi:hypothetical protein
MNKSWSSWKPLKVSCQNYGAASYNLRLMTPTGPLAIARFLGVDKRGLLTIGETGNMEKRRTDFVRAIEKCTGHSEGNLLHLILLHSQIKKLHPEHALQYRFLAEADKAAAKFSEEQMIKSYIRKYGEPPPLNCAIPDRYGNWECENLF